jgi:phage major head subunit gpT-like protein
MSYILDEVVSSVALNDFIQLPNMFAMFYNVRPAGGWRDRHTSVGGLGQFEEKSPTVSPNEDSPTQQFQKTFVHTAFAKRTKVERELVDDEQWGWFEDLGNKYGESANRTMETKGAAPFNDAFAGATYTAEDGLAICYSAHVNVDGGNSQSNAGSTALSVTSVGTTRVAMRNWTDYEGEKIFINPRLLAVPLNLEQTAWEIVRSTLKPGSANNDANFYNGMFDLAVWNYFSDTNNWFMIDPDRMRRNLVWNMRTGLEFYGDGDLFAGTRHIGGYYRESHGCLDWRWIYGHNVA